MEEEQDIEELPRKRWFVIVMALALIFLMVSFTLTSGSVREVILSLAESATIEDGLVEQDVTVYFENESYEHLLHLYNENLDQEFKACLQGWYEGVYSVTAIYEPVMYFQSWNQVISEACPSDTLIALHSHPYRRCTASAQDLANLEVAQEANPTALMGIMCEDDRFHFYQ
jgi:proteasome lid subunit RPN8/RPN11